jgi:cell division protein YceG involved in septum cleavage
MVRFLKIFFILILVFITELYAQSISGLASVDSSDYLVGDYINYTLEVRAGKNIQITTPFIRDSLKNVELIRELESSLIETENSKSTTYGFTISYYDSGSITIPPIAIKYKTAGNDEEKVVLSNSVTFTVHTVPVEQQAEIKDVKEPLTIPLDWKFILLIVFIVLVVLALAIFLYLRYKKKKSEQPVKKKIIRIPAHVRALTALNKLEEEQLWQKGQVKEYHSNITGIVRNYFEDRFQLLALELTTTEQMQQLNKVRDAENILTETNEFLNNADLVKFAKFIPIASVNEEMMKQAKDIVNQTIPIVLEKVEEEMQNV